MHEPILQASRTLGEATLKDEPWVSRRLGYYHDVETFFEALRAAPKAIVLVDGLVQDDTAVGMITRMQVMRPVYVVVALTQALEAISILQLYALGAAKIGRPGDFQRHPEWLSPSDNELQDLVFPPFLFNLAQQEVVEDVLKAELRAQVIFLGTHALSSFANAVLGSPKSSAPLRMIVEAPPSAWVRESLAAELAAKNSYTIKREIDNVIENDIVILDDITKAIASPNKDSVFIVHGYLNDEHRALLRTVHEQNTVYYASPEGYIPSKQDLREEPILASQFWAKFHTLIQEAIK